MEDPIKRHDFFSFKASAISQKPGAGSAAFKMKVLRLFMDAAP